MLYYELVPYSTPELLRFKQYNVYYSDIAITKLRKVYQLCLIKSYNYESLSKHK